LAKRDVSEGGICLQGGWAFQCSLMEVGRPAESEESHEEGWKTAVPSPYHMHLLIRRAIDLQRT
jgi:hypothetical protein